MSNSNPLPSRVGSKDLVTGILVRRDAVRLKIERQRETRKRNRCLGTGSCDCPLCK